MIHPLFDQWFGIKAAEYNAPRPTEELVCLTDKARQALGPKSLNEIMSAIAKARIDKARTGLADKTPEQRRQILRAEWSRMLGPVTPAKPAIIQAQSLTPKRSGARRSPECARS